jgi:hypothetical protein
LLEGEENAGVASGKKTFVCSDEHAARHLAYIDEDIAETERRIAEDQLSLLRLKSKREQAVSDRAAALSLAAAEEAAVRALRARVDALVEKAFPAAGQQQQAGESFSGFSRLGLMHSPDQGTTNCTACMECHGDGWNSHELTLSRIPWNHHESPCISHGYHGTTMNPHAFPTDTMEPP